MHYARAGYSCFRVRVLAFMVQLSNARYVVRQLVVMLLLILAAPPATATAQRQTPGQLYSVAGLIPKPLGDLKTQVDRGKGIAFAAVWTGTPDRAFAIRLDAGWTTFDQQPQLICVASDTGGCRAEFTIQRRNNIISMHLGPQLMVHSGFARPYVHIGAGLSRFSTAAPADYVDVKDYVVSGLGGAGLLVPLKRGGTEVFLDMGARYM